MFIMLLQFIVYLVVIAWCFGLAAKNLSKKNWFIGALEKGPLNFREKNMVFYGVVAL